MGTYYVASGNKPPALGSDGVTLGVSVDEPGQVKLGRPHPVRRYQNLGSVFWTSVDIAYWILSFPFPLRCVGVPT